MIKLTDIYTAVGGLLRSKYNYAVNQDESKEGFEKPSFFVQLKPKTMSNESIHYKRYEFTIIITYFQEVYNEIDNYIKIDEIQELFGNHIRINENEAIHINDYDYDFIGTKTNILQISLEIEFYKHLEVNEGSEILTDLVMNKNLKLL